LYRKRNKQTKLVPWLSLIKSIKKRASLFLQSVKLNGPELSIGNRPLVSTQAKYIYNCLLGYHYDNSVEVPAISRFLSSKEEVDWSDVYSYVYSCTSSTKLQEFQFKFLHNILVNQYWLHKWKIADSDLCTLCQKEPETLDHLVWNCECVKPFWKAFVNFVYDIFKLRISKDDIYLGTKDKLLTLLSVVAKQYVYQCRYRKVHPIFVTYRNKLLYIQKIEESVFKCKNKSMLWFEKWEPLIM